MSVSALPETTCPECHPIDGMMRRDRLPHILCPGCGIGPSMHAYAEAVRDSGIDQRRHVCVSGIGCSGRTAGYVNLDSYHTTHGRAIPFALGIAVQNPELEVTVISGDGDLTAIGGNHFIHAARRNVDLTILCINNFIYGMTGGQAAPTTPTGAHASTMPFGCWEQPFNLVYLAKAVGASFVARWTSLHVRQLKEAIARALNFKGFAFIEILSPCPTGFGKANDLKRAIDTMSIFRERCVVKNDAPEIGPFDVNIMDPERPIVLGNFVDKPREPFRPALAGPVEPPRSPEGWAEVRPTRYTAETHK